MPRISEVHPGEQFVPRYARPGDLVRQSEMVRRLRDREPNVLPPSGTPFEDPRQSLHSWYDLPLPEWMR